MKKYYLFAGLALLAASPAFAQTKIGAAGAPDGSAMLEVTSGTGNNKGLLLPRMTTTQRNAITSPANGLMIYNTTTNQAQVNTGTPAAPVWTIATATNSGWNLTGNTGTNPSTNFIGTIDSQSFVIRTDNTEQVRVTAAGKVGINNTNPLSPLSFESVIGSKISFFSSGTTNHYGIGVSSNQLNYHVNPGATHTFFAGGTNGDGTELMRIQSNGDVGIGTSAPAQTLHVAGTARISTAAGTPTTITGRSAAGDIGNVTIGSGLAFSGGTLSATPTTDNTDWNLTGNTGTSPTTNFIGTSDAQPLVIRTDNTEQVRVTAAGNVGIGTAAPTQTLDIVGTARIRNATGTPTTIAGRNNNGDVGAVTLGSGLSLTAGVLNTTADNADWNLTGNTGTNPATNFIGTGDAQPLVIRTSNTEKVRVTAAGNVGIGTTAPAYTLDVAGGIKASSEVLTASNSGSAMVWNSVNTGQGATELINYRGTGGGGFRFSTAAPGVVPAAGVGELMRITGAGDVGIGTATPAQTLHVAGTARITTAAGTPTTITGRNAAGDVGNVTLGTGINLTAGVLSVPPAPIQLLQGAITTSGVNITASTTGWLYTGATITLPANSTFKVTADMLLSIAAPFAGTFIVPADQSLWVRSTFADSPTGGPSADLIGSNLMSGNISTGMTRNMLHGTVALSNTTNAPKTYYYIVGNVETYGFTPTVYGFCSAGAGENQIYAIPVN
ncbi:beta strand repeat-containing protein [Taibaiella chishuiensis]|uniref:Autotransporter-associated beta strand protein n=1 Tax=Taibaiella chishuiensis TaxID=1434707 RepID=A0A2P8D219_9BACT|nr:hypothetical protein [Taibaiella chishuiensis]PSK91262.1 hypothetical protein B0I18_106274 [Taibaiella chishuiensis]